MYDKHQLGESRSIRRGQNFGLKMENLKQHGGDIFFEAIVLFIGVPLLFYCNVVPFSKLAALMLVALLCGYILWQNIAINISILPGQQGQGW